MISRRTTDRPPALLILLGCVGLALFVLPLIGLLARVPWARLPELLSGGVVAEALRLSVVTSISATAVSLVLGVPLAWLLARVDFPGRSIVRGVVTLPLVLLAIPSVIIGYFAIEPMLYGDFFKNVIFINPELHPAMHELAEEFHSATAMARIRQPRQAHYNVYQLAWRGGELGPGYL